jgi:hypothetical protein
VNVVESFGDSYWSGLFLGGIKEFHSIKYAIMPDDEDYVILIEPSSVHIWLAKPRELDDKSLPDNVVRMKKKLCKKK